MLLNSHGLGYEKRLKTPGFPVYQQYFANDQNGGVAIAVEDEFLSKTLATETDTPDGPLLKVTSYLLPRCNYLHYHEFLCLVHRQTPVILVRDVYARHTYLGYTITSQVVRDIIECFR